MGSGYSQLTHRGPFQKPSTGSSFLGMPIQNYTMPLINPEDGSYMPTCALGPCAQYVYRPYYDRGMMRQRAHCVRYGPPTRIPQQTNMFSYQPGSPRHSCGWASPDNNSQYYVAYNPGHQQQVRSIAQIPAPQYQYGVPVRGGLKTRNKKKRNNKTLKEKRQGNK
jgi:hypothetical protein